MRGGADLRFACLRSVSIVGTRAATAYGTHVTVELAAALAERGWTVLSGGAFGIDSRAHRGALAAEGVTVAVLPPQGPVLPRDELDPVSLSVLEAVPARVGRGPARIAVSAGVDFDTVLRCLGELAAGGFVERCERGWRARLT